jgi:hypothetical protein
MKKGAVLLGLVLLAVGVAWYFFSAHPSQTPIPLPEANGLQEGPATAAGGSPGAPGAALESLASTPPSDQLTNASQGVLATPPAPVEPLPPELAALPPATILENLRTSVRLYGQMFGGNPVGTNPEITAALMGNNPKHLNFLKADGNRVNANGELVDAWGTPYFFHQLSGSQTEIRSAGLDRIMYTLDDLVIR